MTSNYKLIVQSPRGDGHRTEVECPVVNCKGEILYNGNYFCNTCKWVMPVINRRFLKTCLTGLRDCALKAGDIAYAERCQYYLNHYD